MWGRSFGYTLTATNTGNVTLTGVSITDPMLGTLDCTQPVTLAPGESLVCTGTYTVTEADLDTGQIDNTATTTGTAPDDTQVSDQDAVTVGHVPTEVLDEAIGRDDLPAVLDDMIEQDELPATGLQTAHLTLLALLLAALGALLVLGTRSRPIPVGRDNRHVGPAPRPNHDSSPQETSAAMLTDRLRYAHHVDAFGHLDDDATWHCKRE